MLSRQEEEETGSYGSVFRKVLMSTEAWLQKGGRGKWVGREEIVSSIT